MPASLTNAELVRYLAAFRRECRALTARSERAADREALDAVCTVIGRMIFDIEQLPGLTAAAAERMAALAGARPGDDPASLLAIVRSDREFVTAAAADLQSSIVADSAGEREAREEPPEFDLEALAAFLSSEVEGGEPVEVVAVGVPSRGFSKKTLLVGLRGNRVLPAEIAIRIDQPANHFGTTVVDEFPLLRELSAHGARVPRPFALEGTGDVLGTPFIVFPKVPGAMVGHVYLSPPRDEGLNDDAAHCLARIHAVPIDALGAEAEAGHPHLHREVAKVSDDWRALGESSATIDAAFSWVRANVPEPVVRAVVHNDFNFHNLMVEHGRVTAVLDWEFAHLGDPAADLGYFFYAAEGIASFEAFLAAYERAGGILPAREVVDFYILWGQLRLAVMVYQVDVFFRRGMASDVRYALSGSVNRYRAVERVNERLEHLLT